MQLQNCYVLEGSRGGAAGGMLNTLVKQQSPSEPPNYDAWAVKGAIDRKVKKIERLPPEDHGVGPAVHTTQQQKGK